MHYNHTSREDKEIFFSLVIVVYNKETVILDLLKTILYQNYPNFEVIVVDIGSQDNTAGVLKLVNDERVRYFYKEHKTTGAARNYGVLQAGGDYITFIDADDLLYNIHLVKACDCMRKHHYPSVFHLSYEVRNDAHECLKRVNKRKGALHNKILRGEYCTCSGLFIRHDVAGADLFHENTGLSGIEEWVLWLRLAARYDIPYSNVITSCLSEKHNRKNKQPDKDKVKTVINALTVSLHSDEAFMKKWGHMIKVIEARLFTGIALYMVKTGKKQQAAGYLLKAFTKAPFSMFTFRIPPVVKQLVT